MDQVRIYRAESNRSDILAVDWTEDIKVTSSACARRVTVSDAGVSQKWQGLAAADTPSGRFG